MKGFMILLFVLLLSVGVAFAGNGGNGGTGGAGVTKANPRQAGKSSIHFYDVVCSNNPNPECESCKSCNGYGTFVIDTEHKTFNFIGHDYAPMSKVKIENFGVVVRGKATQSGNVHIQGAWKDTVVPPDGTVGESWGWYDPAFGFAGQNLGGYNCHLKIRWSIDDGKTWNTTSVETSALSFGESYNIYIEDFDPDNIIPDHAEIQLKARVVGGDDTWTSDIWYYAKGGDPMFCFPYCLMHGPTWNAYIEYYNDQCQYNLDSDYWYIWGVDVWEPPRD
jgi:hypothetical protein